MQGLDQSSLSDQSVLSRPGERPGQVVIVEIDGKGPTVFQWDQDASTWQEVACLLSNLFSQSNMLLLDWRRPWPVKESDARRKRIRPCRFGQLVFDAMEQPRTEAWAVVVAVQVVDVVVREGVAPLKLGFNRSGAILLLLLLLLLLLFTVG